ncbi:MAG: putative sugar O-methyltransferase [Chloroflexi bacterium]|nr:putative sugar O-methyltransferase [Chloroflexota bacterium]
MRIRSAIKNILRKLLAKIGFDIIPKVLVYDWQRGDLPVETQKISLPNDAMEYLNPENPTLIGFQERYQTSNYPISEILLWTEDRVKAEDILYFRGHNAFVFQEGRFNRNLFGYLLAYYYVKSMDCDGLLNILEEDSAFGAITYIIDNKPISRDLLDSIIEIYFLENNLGIFQKDELSILDIGAGYGRLAHRMVKAVPKLKSYICTDAIPVSSFIADYYLRFRGIDNKARVLGLDTIEKDLNVGEMDLAVNIHSFSECTLTAIEWWLKLLREKEIPALMIVPNSGAELFTNDGHDFQPLVEKYGYELMAREPKYKDPVVQKYAVNPDHLYLFKLEV